MLHSMSTHNSFLKIYGKFILKQYTYLNICIQTPIVSSMLVTVDSGESLPLEQVKRLFGEWLSAAAWSPT